jgi:hypothetical protein
MIWRKEPLERPRHRYQDNINMGVKEIRCVRGIYFSVS